MSNIMSYTIKNVSINAQAIGDVFLQPNSSTTVAFLNIELLTAASNGYITITPSDNDTITLQASYGLMVDSTGGVSGNGTVAALNNTSTATLATTTANALSTIIQQVNALTAAVNNQNAAMNYGATRIAALNV